MKKLLLLAAGLLLGLGAYAQETSHYEIYLVGADTKNESGTTWQFIEGMQGTTEDGVNYAWDFEASPMEITGPFKFSTSDWGTMDVGADQVNEVSFTDGVFSTTGKKAGSNFVLPPNTSLKLTSISLNIETFAIQISGEEIKQDPADAVVYIRGTVNDFLDSDINAGTVDERWIGKTNDGDTFVWDFAKENIILSGTFKIADATYGTFNYGSDGAYVYTNTANELTKDVWNCEFNGSDSITKVVFTASTGILYIYDKGSASYEAVVNEEGNTDVTFTASIIYGETAPENLTGLRAEVYDMEKPDVVLTSSEGSMSVAYTMAADAQIAVKARWIFKIASGEERSLESYAYSQKPDNNMYIRGEVNNYLTEDLKKLTVDEKWIGVTNDEVNYSWDFRSEPIDFGSFFYIANADYSIMQYVGTDDIRVIGVEYNKTEETYEIKTVGKSTLNAALNDDGTVTVTFAASEIFGETAETVENLGTLTGYLRDAVTGETLVEQEGLAKDGTLSLSYTATLNEGDYVQYYAVWDFYDEMGRYQAYRAPEVFTYTHSATEKFGLLIQTNAGAESYREASIVDGKLTFDFSEEPVPGNAGITEFTVSSSFQVLSGGKVYLNDKTNIIRYDAWNAPTSVGFEIPQSDNIVEKIEFDFTNPDKVSLLITGSHRSFIRVFVRGSVNAWEVLDEYVGTTEDGITYTWGEVKLAGEFKFGDADWKYNFGAESGKAEVALDKDGIYSAVLNSYDNMTLPTGTELTTESITLNVKTGELTIKGATGELDPLDYKPLLRGTFNSYLNTEISEKKEIAAKWRGVTSDEGATYTWDFSEDPLVINTRASFLIADSIYAYHYYGGPEINPDQYPVSLGESYQLYDKGGDMHMATGATITGITLDVANKTLVVNGTVTGIGEDTADAIRLYAAEGRICLAGSDAEMTIYDLIGNEVANGSLSGIYIVKVGEVVEKVRVP